MIATHGRARLLAETLDAIEGQTRDDIEVVVVDDDSHDETPDLLRQRRVRAIRVSRRGPGQARQVGWQAARAPIVAFTDDDCVPAPAWLETIAGPIEREEADFVQGRTLPRPDQAERLGPWSRTQKIEWENGHYATCNMAYRRDVLEGLGGFRPEFWGPRTSGEDADLGWRALEAGYRSAFVPEALVYHEIWPPSYWAHLKDRARWGMIVQVIRYHPEARRMGYRRYFFRRTHVRAIAVLAVLAAAAAIRRSLPVILVGAGAGEYLIRSRQSPVPPARRLFHLAQVFGADVVEVAVFAGASIRYRTLLL